MAGSAEIEPCKCRVANRRGHGGEHFAPTFILASDHRFPECAVISVASLYRSLAPMV